MGLGPHGNPIGTSEEPRERDAFVPFGGDDAAKKLASVDARLKTFATRRG